MNKFVSIVGARPQFIKAAMISNKIQNVDGIEEIMVHTGQHFDANMSDIFFNQLDISRPEIHHHIHGGNHGEMTGRMLVEIEKTLIEHKPDGVLVYGDTNSTLAGALASSKLHIPIAHVESGLRSFDIHMPEEVNRIVTDRLSDILLCPTDISIHNLECEGFKNLSKRVVKVGDVMQDAALFFASRAVAPAGFKLDPGFILSTVHRAENTDDPERLTSIISALNDIHQTVSPVVLPLHPRTHNAIKKLGLELKVHLIEPVGYLEMIWLLNNCGLVLTDSGGVQKEAFFFGKACVTLRDQTEWVELVNLGVNDIVGADCKKIIESVNHNFGRVVHDTNELYGGGRTSQNIVNELMKWSYE